MKLVDKKNMVTGSQGSRDRSGEGGSLEVSDGPDEGFTDSTTYSTTTTDSSMDG